MVQCQLYDISGFERLEILKIRMEYLHKRRAEIVGFIILKKTSNP